MAYDVLLDWEKCNGCESCVEVCPVEVYEMGEGVSQVMRPEECLGCESCIEVCDQDCIQIIER